MQVEDYTPIPETRNLNAEDLDIYFRMIDSYIENKSKLVKNLMLQIPGNDTELTQTSEKFTITHTLFSLQKRKRKYTHPENELLRLRAIKASLYISVDQLKEAISLQKTCRAIKTHINDFRRGYYLSILHQISPWELTLAMPITIWPETLNQNIRRLLKMELFKEYFIDSREPWEEQFLRQRDKIHKLIEEKILQHEDILP